MTEGKEVPTKITLVELLTEHAYYYDEGCPCCECGALPPKGEFRVKESWQWWIGHVQQAIGEKVIEMTYPGFSLIPHADYGCGPYTSTLMDRMLGTEEGK